MCEREQYRLKLWKGRALTQEGQRKISFVVFGLAHPEFLFVFLPGLLLNAWLYTFQCLLKDHCFPQLNIFSTQLI